MAIRITAGTGLLRTSGLWDYNSPYTFMGWFLTESVTSYGTYMLSWASNFNNQDCVQRAGSGSPYVLDVWVGGASTALTGPAIPLGTWQHLAVVRESVTACKLYVDGVLVGTNTRDVTGRTFPTETRVGRTTVDLDGRCAALKAWGIALTVEQVRAEMHTTQPRHWPTEIWGFWPCQSGTERLTDCSGRARNWTAVGTLTDVDPPAVGWGAPVLESPVVAVEVAGQGYTIPPLTITTGVVPMVAVVPAAFGYTIPPLTVTTGVPPLIVQGGVGSGRPRRTLTGVGV